MRESLQRRTLDNITVLMICFKNFKHKIFPRNKEEPKHSESLNKRSEVSTSQSAQMIRPHTSGAAPKQDYKALRERVNNQKSSESNYSNSGIATRSYSFLKENSSNISGVHADGKRAEKESISFTKDAVNKHALKGGNFLAENDENQNSDAYLNYLQHSKISKTKAMDYKSGEFLKSSVQGDKKL